jgi:tRNA A-37 threonylcarbamoyl transferase component Bud32
VKAEIPPLFSPGQRFGGYEVIGLIGKGGMGEVYRARQLSMDREVALKILSPRLALKDPSFAQRFVDEARAAGRLNHPNVVHVHDVSTATLADGSAVHFFSMEFIAGESVQDLLNRDKRLTPAQIAPIMLGVAQALSFAAKVGIVHRDIKPDNIMITRTGAVKVADLGLAIQSQNGDDHQPERDEHGRAKVMGTPLYLSPEQARALPVDHRSDQYSLGATLFHLLTGDAPYRGLDAKSILKAHVVEPVPDAGERYPEADPAWAELAKRLMQKRPDERFANAEDLVEAVEAATRGITLTQLARQKLGFQMPMWGWYGLGGAAAVLAFVLLMTHGSTPEPAPTVPAATVPAATVPAATKLMVVTPIVSPPVPPPVLAALPPTPTVSPLPDFDQALREARFKDAQEMLKTADSMAPTTLAASNRLATALIEARKVAGARIANATLAELATVLDDPAFKAWPDADQTWLRETIEAQRKDLTPVVKNDADHWRDLARQLDKLRSTRSNDGVKGVVTQASTTFEDAKVQALALVLADIGELAQKGEGCLRAYIGAAQPHTTVVINGTTTEVVLNRLSRTEVFYIVQAGGEPGPEQKIARANVGMPWAELLDEAIKDQGIENSQQVKAACLWMWVLPEATDALDALGDAPLAQAVKELEKYRQ